MLDPNIRELMKQRDEARAAFARAFYIVTGRHLPADLTYEQALDEMRMDRVSIEDISVREF
jgi:hypothetical protein